MLAELCSEAVDRRALAVCTYVKQQGSSSVSHHEALAQPGLLAAPSNTSIIQNRPVTASLHAGTHTDTRALCNTPKHKQLIQRTQIHTDSHRAQTQYECEVHTQVLRYNESNEHRDNHTHNKCLMTHKHTKCKVFTDSGAQGHTLSASQSHTKHTHTQK